MNSRFPAHAAVCLLSLVIASSAIPSAAGAEDTRSGAIGGTVHIKKRLTEQRMRFRLYPGFTPPPPVERDTREDEWRNVVIYLSDVPPTPGAASEGGGTFEMAQEGEAFIPHVLPILVGSTVSFPNHDPIFHNVFSLSGTGTFDLGRYPRGDTRSVTFDRPGIVPVFCHIHSDMSAIIVVLENPYFTVPGADGRFLLEGIPAGTYTLVAWHERSEPVETRVEVVEGQTLELDITVPIEDEEPSRP